jgi:hypothetical protein
LPLCISESATSRESRRQAVHFSFVSAPMFHVPAEFRLPQFPLLDTLSVVHEVPNRWNVYATCFAILLLAP